MVWAHQGLPSIAGAMAYSKESIPTLGVLALNGSNI